MSQDIATRSKNYKVAAAQVSQNTAESIIEMIATQLDRIDDARTRIDAEGIVVRDLRGSVIPHPAIVIEQNAIKLAETLISKHRNLFGI